MKILFVCEYNACRSQIAEGIARSFLPSHWQIESAGIYPGTLTNITIETVQEIGIDISRQYSKRVYDLKDKKYDLVILLAEPLVKRNLGLECPKIEFWPFPDPVCEPGEREELKKKIRKVRDALIEKIKALPEKFS